MSDLRRLAEPLNVGGVEIRNRVFLAPMSGITDEPFRLRAYRHGAGLVVSEMVASGELAKGRQGTATRIRHSGLPVHMVQLAGREAHHMAEARAHRGRRGRRHHRHQHGLPGQEGDRRLFRLGADARPRPRGVADRCGDQCRRRAGHGEDAARLGRGDAQRAAAGSPRRAVRRENGDVHGRTRCQFYQGKADWRAIARIKQAVSIPVVANGDVGTPADAAAILENSGADAVMIGRAHYGAPWAAGAIAASRRPAASACRQPPARTGRLRRRALPGHAVALRRRKRPAAGAQASRLVSRPPRAVSCRRDAQGDPDGDRAGRRHRCAAAGFRRALRAAAVRQAA